MMATMCVQCAMKAIVEGKVPPVFDEDISEHMRRCHPDPEATKRERRELEDKLREMNLYPQK